MEKKIKAKIGCKNEKFKRKDKIAFERIKSTYEKNKFNHWSGERLEKYSVMQEQNQEMKNDDLDNDGYEGQRYDQRNINVSKKGKNSKDVYN